ncbi:molybdenum cofactor biosynthesis protein F [Thelonectria olida]|uniref:Molybdenum cofactor biosynthesis protein F n=1 Tax=Thelonectria olida TaxID=1576542 RepID=A0A9P9ADS8_9HYPO|nr:molybdenum cofactor biosynthesis protein F [Thelonectria olida]
MSASTETPGYVPASAWPSLEELAVGYGEHLMPSSHKLSGKTFDHTFDNGNWISHHFIDTQKLTWKILGGGHEKDLTGDVQYKAFEVRPDMFLVDFYKAQYEEHVSLVLDISTGQAVVGLSGFVEKNGQRRTWTKFSNAHMNGSSKVSSYQDTEELIGKHILYRYTPRDAYEHVYLNKGTFVWHCLSGIEKGLADAEPCRVMKLRDQLYLLFWTETIMPVESVVIVDLEALRSTGRFFCWDPKPQRAVHMLFGSYATILGETNAAEILARPLSK